MNVMRILPGALCIVAALALMVCLMHYAHFYGPSYCFWIGTILIVLGLVSLIKPLTFLFVSNRTIAMVVLGGGFLTLTVALFWPVTLTHVQTGQIIDQLAPEYAFHEYHERIINASPEIVKKAFCNMGVGDIPVVHLLLKIRGIDDGDIRDNASTVISDDGIVKTPDFDWFVVDSTEYITFMLLNVSAKTPPPTLTSIDQFNAFNKPGYNKVAVNFRFVRLPNGQTLVSTETRNFAQTPSDNRRFGRYWRVIYPGSALIRQVWLDTLAKKAAQMEQQNKQHP